VLCSAVLVAVFFFAPFRINLTSEKTLKEASMSMAKKNTATKTAEQSTGPKILISRFFLDIIVKLPLLLDSLATVQLLVEIEGQLGIQVPVSDFDREVWGTPKQNKALDLRF
jgi:D-alanine--poly(phosphoribitol) ligase subunit 2